MELSSFIEELKLELKLSSFIEELELELKQFHYGKVGAGTETVPLRKSWSWN